MKKKIIIAAMMAIAITAQAQTQKYNNGHKYDLLSNLEIGISGQYSYALAGKAGNWGADIRMTKRLGNNWRLRGIADINGFGRKENYDRYAKAMVGLSADFLPFYMFADYGLSYNPTAPQKFNPAGDAGIGLHFDIGRGLRFYTEVGADRTAHGNNEWSSDAFVKVGYAFNLGITENDRKEIDIDNNMRNTYGTLKEENQLLKSEAKKKDDDNAKLQELLERSTAALELATQRLNNCQDEVQQVTENCQKPLPTIRFEYATAYLIPTEEDNVAEIADAINADNSGSSYIIEGYCSRNGDPYKNQKLSEERAWAVFNALVALDVNSARLIVVGNGMSDIDSTREQKVSVRKAL